MQHLISFNDSVKNNYYNIDRIIHYYFQTALWTEDHTIKNISIFSDESIKQTKSEIKWFVDILTKEGITDIPNDSIGHDLWLTRNHHGAGFRDRGFDDNVEDLLVKLSFILGEVYIYIGDDDKIHMTENSKKYKEFNLKKYKEEIELGKNIKKYNL